MRYELKHIGIWSLTKVAFFVNLAFGFIVGLFYAMLLPLMLMPMGGASLYGAELDMGGIGFGMMFIILPIVCAFFCAVFQTMICIILALVYNLVARLLGGLELRLGSLEVVASPAPAVPVSPTVAPSPPAGTPPPPPPPPSTMPPLQAAAPTEPTQEPLPPKPDDPPHNDDGSDNPDDRNPQM